MSQYIMTKYMTTNVTAPHASLHSITMADTGFRCLIHKDGLTGLL